MGRASVTLPSLPPLFMQVHDPSGVSSLQEKSRVLAPTSGLYRGLGPYMREFFTFSKLPLGALNVLKLCANKECLPVSHLLVPLI